MSAERILIVEDDDYLRKASEIALRRAGYTVISAPTGREGLNLARSEQPHLIILDLLMPQPTGLEILRTLRSENATKTTPIMVISNSSMQRVVDEVTGLGAEYIVKADLSLKELAGRVERKLASAAPQTPPPAAPTAAAPAAPEAKPATPPPAPAQTRPAPPPAPVVASKPLPGEETETFECAGCGSMIGIRAAFCPKCGRPLAEARGGRGWRAETR